MTDNGYDIQYAPEALEDLQKLPMIEAKRILQKIERLALYTIQVSHIALKGQWAGHFKLRIGDYRVIYSLDHTAKLVEVKRIRHRREVYE